MQRGIHEKGAQGYPKRMRLTILDRMVGFPANPATAGRGLNHLPRSVP